MEFRGIGVIYLELFMRYWVEGIDMVTKYYSKKIINEWYIHVKSIQNGEPNCGYSKNYKWVMYTRDRYKMESIIVDAMITFWHMCITSSALVFVLVLLTWDLYWPSLKLCVLSHGLLFLFESYHLVDFLCALFVCVKVCLKMEKKKEKHTK
jgi:hypothetical protein